MKLEGIMIRETSQTEKDKHFMISLIHWIKEKNKLTEKRLEAGEGMNKMG